MHKDPRETVEPPNSADDAVELESDEAFDHDVHVPLAAEGEHQYIGVNAAHKAWLDGGRPNIDSDHPLSKGLLEAIRLYATHDTDGFVNGNNKNSHLTTEEGKNNLNVRAAREKVNQKRLIQRKIARARRALASYDSKHPAGASFVTYLKKPFDHADVDELRRVMKPTIQKLLRDYYGRDLHDEIDAEPERDYETDEPVHPEQYLTDNLRPLAHWIGRQPDGLRITWRTVARAFPDDFGSEDKAQRALKAIKAWFARVGHRRFNRRR